MLNKITRRVPISRYTVDYVVEGFEGSKKHVVFETLSGVGQSDLLEIAEMYINMYETSDRAYYMSTDYTEKQLGLRTYEMPLTHFIEHAICRGEKNVPEEE